MLVKKEDNSRFSCKKKDGVFQKLVVLTYIAVASELVEQDTQCWVHHSWSVDIEFEVDGCMVSILSAGNIQVAEHLPLLARFPTHQKYSLLGKCTALWSEKFRAWVLTFYQNEGGGDSFKTSG